MSLVAVQCKGSGQPSGASYNAKRSICPFCHIQKDIRSDGKFRKHTRLTKTRDLK